MNNRVMFYKIERKMFFKYQGINYRANPINISKLKEKIFLPFCIDFIDCSNEDIKKIVSNFCDIGIEVKIEKVKDVFYHGKHFIASFYEKKNYIDAYKIPNMIYYAKSKHIRPYILIELNGKRILMEVTKDYAKKNEGVYYFLAKDLTDEEKLLFNKYDVYLEYDLLYKIDEEEQHKYKQHVLKK